jgi:hypothetical protein
MTARDLYSVGARLLGLYLVIHSLVSLLGLVETYDAAVNSKASNPFGYALVAGAQATLLTLIGFTLFLRNRISNVASATGTAPAEFLLAGLQLSGVYFAVAGVASILHSLADLTVSESWTLHLTGIVSALFYAGAGLFLVFRAPVVVRTIAA